MELKSNVRYSMLEKITGKSDSYLSAMPFHAYEGNEPYIFVSYAHADADLVFPELKRLHDAGLNIWYDQGIAPGNEWTEEIGNALEGCSLFIVFISKNSANSINVRNEINYALHDNKRFLSIYLEETELPSGLKLSMGSLQSILKYGMDESEYIFRCNKALRQNGFDISSDGSIKYNVETISKKSTRSSTGKSNSKLPYIAIGAIAIIAIIGIAMFALPSSTDQNSDAALPSSTGQSSDTASPSSTGQSSDTSLQIRSADVDEDGWCFIWGTFTPVPSDLDKLRANVKYYDSSGNLIDSVSESIDPTTEVSGEYLISGTDVHNATIGKVNVTIMDMNDNPICSDEFKP